jgi:DnaJ-class molecular chaperone
MADVDDGSGAHRGGAGASPAADDDGTTPVGLPDTAPPPPPPNFARFDSRTGDYVKATARPRPSSPASLRAETRRLKKQGEAASLIALSTVVLIATLVAVLVGPQLLAGIVSSSSSSLPWSGAAGSSSRGSHFSSSSTSSSRVPGGPRPGPGPQYEEASHPTGRKMRDTEMQARVSLDKLYRSDALEISWTRTAICSACGGEGGHGVRRCDACGGSGAHVSYIRHGHMVQQIQQACPHCGGQGRTREHTCGACGGAGRREERLEARLHLSPGLRDGDTVRIPRGGDQHPGVGDGDLLVRIEEVPGPQAHVRPVNVFRGAAEPRPGTIGPVGRRAPSQVDEPGRNDDLEVDLYVTLREALLGFSRTVRHPGDGHDVQVESSRPVAPGQTLLVAGEGMPRRSADAAARSFVVEEGASWRLVEMQKHLDGWEAPQGGGEGGPRGDLHAHIHVRLPDGRLSREQELMIERLFPAGGEAGHMDADDEGGGKEEL